MDFAVGLVLVRKEHQAELADDCIEAAIRKRQRGRIGGLELNFLAGLKLGARDLKHRRIEIGRHQTNALGQKIAQLARDYPGAQHPRRSARGGTLRHLEGVVHEKHWSETLIVVMRYAAGETCCVILHDESPVFSARTLAA